MEFKLLGPFEAHREGQRVRLDSRRQERCLLAVLLMHEGRAVTARRLIDLLWDGAAPASARGAVHTYVGRLRAALAPYGLTLATRQSGYAVEGQYDLDVPRFNRLVRQASAEQGPAERLRLYDRALALWRGPLLADLADDRLRDRLGGPLDEMRLTALEERAGIQLTLGLHEQVAAELDAACAAHPQRERLVAARMTALYRAGRQADALELYDATRQRLAGTLGVDPGAELRTLHTRMLRGDHRLDRPPAPVYAVRVGDEWLPWTTSGHPALELCNTRAGWGTEQSLPGSEWLRRYSTLAVWAGHLDLAGQRTVDGLQDHARRRPEEAIAALDEAREFRARLYACLTAPDDVGAFTAVARAAEAAARHASFTRGGDGLGVWRISPSAGLRLPLYAAALSAAELLAGPQRFTVRACPGDHCGWLFLDTGGRRRWCSLATCGAAEACGGRADDARS
ncbi:BTAD domain-containing putative transcriptional regulator [Streptomyces sp. MUM 178J]|uniref:BTAD domain-containing putative transcriptional regulator n=1 Tax=Streptomyces sp. MUM 178J TaxID=2791991 RepID=UPI001F04B516|nr:BTAD domain-containing putative transcriptional regulator [Streptomyces sp. MUM 178J]WRQ78129.1 BTAD domain-containing putative transcriptional regulator [Streptomyces sp. MUM 178J]